MTQLWVRAQKSHATGTQIFCLWKGANQEKAGLRDGEGS